MVYECYVAIGLGCADDLLAGRYEHLASTLGYALEFGDNKAAAIRPAFETAPAKTGGSKEETRHAITLKKFLTHKTNCLC